MDGSKNIPEQSGEVRATFSQTTLEDAVTRRGSTIKEVLESKPFSKAYFFGKITKKSINMKKNKDTYMTLTLVDCTGEIEVMVWDDVEDRDSKLSEGQIIGIRGVVKEYNGAINIGQLNNFEHPDPDEDMSDGRFTPSYQDNESFDAIATEMVDVIESLSEPYRSFVKACLAKASPFGMTDFLAAPAAVRHHQNKLGGLLLHTYGVYKLIDGFINFYSSAPISGIYDLSAVIVPDRLRALAILHDMCKVEEYEWRPTIGKRKNVPCDHRVLFKTLSDKVNEETNLLSKEELCFMQYCVLAHHGPYGEHTPRTIEDTLLYLADMVDSRASTCAETGDASRGINVGLKGILDSLG